MLLADVIMLPVALWAAFALRLSDWWPGQYLEAAVPLFLLIAPLGILIFIRLGLYRAVVRFMGSQAVWAVIKGVALISCTLYLFSQVLSINPFPRSVPLIFAMVTLIFVGGSRFFVRNYYSWLVAFYSEKKPVLIYGAGYAGVELSNSLENDKRLSCIGFVDDDSALWGSVIAGKKVSPPDVIEKLIADKNIAYVLLAMPSAPQEQRKAILNRLAGTAVHVKTVPTYQELVSGEADLASLRDIEVEDLLGRESVPPVPELLERSVMGRVVLVTGAGGSIGSEICKKVLSLQPKQLILLDVNEYNLYSVDALLANQQAEQITEVPVITLLGSVLDEKRISSILKRFSVETIYHAAAYKHVPLVEHNIVEGVRNNVFGTDVVARAAIASGVGRFILISTDKAVRPTNVMGATKRLAEQVLQSYASSQTGTIFSMVRFGNVLGSSGSVVPLFRQQIEAGGPVTVTHPDIIRYFMTIPEAASLVIQAGSMARGGEVFLLDMGEPVSIDGLARRMIHLMGFQVKSQETPDGDIEIQYTGLRAGEKLYEELLIGDNVSSTEHPGIAKGRESFLDVAELNDLLSDLSDACDSYDGGKIMDLLQKGVQGYTKSARSVDYLL
ncbi:MAG: polysaccharide biosynthesis protein [Pseudoalteromonas sp.]|nr:polysaccharide biosynthesis protein [Pseudoalteromonas sp.]